MSSASPEIVYTTFDATICTMHVSKHLAANILFNFSGDQETENTGFPSHHDLPRRVYPVPFGCVCLAIVEPIGWKRLFVTWWNWCSILCRCEAYFPSFLRFRCFFIFSFSQNTDTALLLRFLIFYLFHHLHTPFGLLSFCPIEERKTLSTYNVPKCRDNIFKFQLLGEFHRKTTSTDGMALRYDGAPNRILVLKKKSFAWFSFWP